MACKSCGSDTPVLEAAPVTEACDECATCSTCNLPTSSCSCSSTSPCQEDHTQTIVSKRYAFTLRATNGFNWPAPFESVTFKADFVERLLIGSIIYNPTAGYLHVTGFDCATQEVTATNEDEVCNTYTGGELLPPCTDFVVGPPNCNPGSTPIPDIPYLAADFISPDDGDCALAAVTNITGLTIEDIISINGYRYRIGNIIDSSTIQLCNDGDGAPIGTVIEWDADGDSIPNIPIVVISSQNPCERVGVSAGTLLVCDGVTAKPLIGTATGEVAIWNNATLRFELRNVSVNLPDLQEDEAVAIPGPFNGVGSSVSTANAVITINNTSAFTTMKVLAIFNFNVNIGMIAPGTVIQYDIQLDIDGGGFNTILQQIKQYEVTATIRDAKTIPAFTIHSIPVGGSMILTAKAIVTNLLGAADTDLIEGTIYLKTLGIAI